MKKELFLLCAAAMLGTVCFSNMTADKASAKTSGDYQYVVTGKKKKTCAIRKYLGNESDVVVPEKIDGYTVTRIGNRAFYDNDNIKSVKLSKYITMIGEKAFSYCYNLESISFPQKVHTIKKRAFFHCGLKKFSLPEKLKTIGKEAFYFCPFEEIHIPQYVESIGKDAFYGQSCTSTKNGNITHYDYQDTLTAITVDERNKNFDSRDNCNAIIKTSSNTLILASNKTVIPDSVTAIGNYAFSNCNEIEEINIPASVTTIGNYAFDRSNLKEITIPSSVNKIGAGAFRYCTLLEKINFSEGLTSIGDGAFEECWHLEEVTIPSSVKTIGDNAFDRCRSLGTINYSEGLTCIGEYAFCSCEPLKEIKLPDSLETIGHGAFGNCSNVESFYIPENLKKTDLNDVFNFHSAAAITVADGNTYYDSRDNCNAVIETSTNTLVMGSRNSTVPDSVTAIGHGAFNNSLLKEISLPASVRKIEAHAFDYCIKLEKVDLTEGLLSIGQSSFDGCKSLKEINLPDSVETIEFSAFGNCDGLKSIRIPKNLKKTDIGLIFSDSDFLDPEGPAVTKITVAEGNPYYDSRNNCNAVIETASNTLVLACKNTVIPKSVKVINRAFLNCDSNLVIPEGVEKIEDYAFLFQSDLKKVTLPSSLKGIGENAFGSSGLKTINYRGSKAQWKKIKIDMDDADNYSDNWLKDAKINYNYKG